MVFSKPGPGPETSDDAPTFLRVENWHPAHPQAARLWPVSFFEAARNRRHWHRLANYAFMAVELVLEGDLLFEQDGCEEIVRTGEAYLVQRAGECLMMTGPSMRYRKMSLVLRGSLLEPVAASMNLLGKFKIRLSNPAAMARLMREIGDLMAAKRAEDICRLGGLTLELLARLSEDASEKKETPPEISEAVRLMESNVTGRLRVADLARAAKCSESTLNRLFKSRLGMSPQDYQINLRMDYAAQLLLSSDLMIKEVADRLGYQNQMYFSNAFRSRFGLSPRQYRDRRAAS